MTTQSASTLPKSSSERIKTGELHVDKAYQRTIKPAQVKRIVDNFSPEAFGSLLVGRRESGKMLIVDGQQRWTAAKKLVMPDVLCSVFASQGRAHEAAVFKLVNNDRTGITSLAVYRACVWAGDTETLAIDAIVRECGFRVPQGQNRSWPNISATGSLYSIYRKRNGGTLLTNVLACVGSAWMKDVDALKGFVLLGIATFLSTFPECDSERLVRSISNTKPGILLDGCDSAMKLMGGSRHKLFAKGVTKLYNKGLRNRLVWPN